MRSSLWNTGGYRCRSADSDDLVVVGARAGAECGGAACLNCQPKQKCVHCMVPVCHQRLMPEASPDLEVAGGGDRPARCGEKMVGRRSFFIQPGQSIAEVDIVTVQMI